MAPRSPTLAEVLRGAIDARLADLHTAIPARVEKYDAATQMVECKPLIKSSILGEDGKPITETLPVVVNVPVVFPGAGGFRLTFPIQPGDTVLLIFSEASIDEWLNDGAEVLPGDARRFNLSDAIAVPGLHPKSKSWTGASTNSVTIGKDGGPQLEITASEMKLNGSGPGMPAATPVAKEGSATTGHSHTIVGTAGPYPIVATINPSTDTIAVGAGSQNVKVP